RDLSGPKTGTNGRHPLPDPETLARTLGRLGIADGMQVVAYDQDSGMFASRLWWLLRWLGHDASAVLDGGFAQWTAEARPIVRGKISARTGIPCSATRPRIASSATADRASPHATTCSRSSTRASTARSSIPDRGASGARTRTGRSRRGDSRNFARRREEGDLA